MDYHCPNNLDVKIEDTMHILKGYEETYCSHNEALGDKGRLPSRGRNNVRAQKMYLGCVFIVVEGNCSTMG